MFAEPVGTVISSSVLRARAYRDRGADPIERARLVALRGSGALDPQLQPAFDQIAMCAAATLNAPLGAVSLVEADTVLLAGAHGFARRRAERPASFCSEVVRLAAPLLSDDAPHDPRFCAHEFVTSGVRSYAGSPILSRAGEVLGAVCAFAGEAHAFHRDSLEALEALAHAVEVLLPAVAAKRASVRHRPGWIGVRTLDANRAGRSALSGLVVLSVAAGSPAEQAGLRATDILHAVDDQVLRERADLVAALADREPGSSARITFQRAGEWMERWVRVTAPPRRARLTSR